MGWHKVERPSEVQDEVLRTRLTLRAATGGAMGKAEPERTREERFEYCIAIANTRRSQPKRQPPATPRQIATQSQRRPKFSHPSTSKRQIPTRASNPTDARPTISSEADRARMRSSPARRAPSHRHRIRLDGLHAPRSQHANERLIFIIDLRTRYSSTTIGASTASPTLTTYHGAVDDVIVNMSEKMFTGRNGLRVLVSTEYTREPKCIGVSVSSAQWNL